MIGQYEQLINAVKQSIYDNTDELITGGALQGVLTQIIQTIGENTTFAGVATLSTNPGTPDQNIFYIAATRGTYPNFNNITVYDKVKIIYTKNGAWSAVELDILVAGSKAFSGSSVYDDFNSYVDSLIKEAGSSSNYRDVLGLRTCSLDGSEVKVETIVLSIVRGDYCQLISGPVLLDTETGRLKRSTKWNMYRRTGLNGAWSYWEDLHTPRILIQGATETEAVANLNAYVNSLIRTSADYSDVDTITGHKEVSALGYVMDVVTRTAGTHLGNYVQKIEGPVSIKADGTLILSRTYSILTRQATNGEWQNWKLLNT